MSLTTDTDNLFQSDEHHNKQAYRAAKSALHKETGNPIKLGSKPLRTVIKQKYGREADAWIGESGFVIRKVGLDSGKTKQIYKGHTGPVTSLAFHTTKPTPSADGAPPKPGRELLISGSWDKSVRVWDTITKTHISTTIAHTDFVKAVTVIPQLSLLVTASSDQDIRIWDLAQLDTTDFTALSSSEQLIATDDSATSSAPPPPPQSGAAPPAPISIAPLPFLLSLKAHTRPIERLAAFPVMNSSVTGEEEDRGSTGRIGLVSVDSLGALKVWELWRNEEGHLKGELKTETRPHEIGIYDLVVSAETGEIWTASSDNSVLLSTFDPTNLTFPPTPNTRIPHPSYCKSLLSLPLALPTLGSSHLLTGSADEQLRIFDLAALDPIPSNAAPWTGTPTAPGEKLDGLVREVEGHTHDIVDLGVYTVEGEGGKTEGWVMSASLDGTLRRWKWPEVLVVPKERTVLIPVEAEEDKKGGMTAEEEKELEDLMGELDD